VAQIYGQLAADLQTDTTSTTLSIEDGEYEVVIVDETDELTTENLMNREFEVTTQDEDGNTVTKTKKLEDFAEQKEIEGVDSISRENLVRYMTVTADTMEGYNTTLLARTVKDKLKSYDVPEGYTVEIAGESESVNETMIELLKMIGLAIIFIYLIMVAQFQSLLSPFIVIFTIPLAFTGGLLGLMVGGEQISMVSMIGFLVLAGVIVNNGIVFVDYVNQLRISGVEKREALVEAGQTRMRPILMTALTTILAMSTMLFSTGLGSEMGKSMALVVIGGLVYATFMTLFVVPVLYDIFYRKKMKVIDVGEDEEL
jgi:HAE1 family hydrophobic/amphiphilic exporter-1